MRKIISLFLSVFLVVFIIVSPVHAADTPNSTNTVEIPCQALNGNTVTEMTVDGIISDNTCYVSLETIAQLTGAEYVDGTNTLFFRKEQTENSDYYTGNSGAYLAYLFDPEQSILEEYSGFFQNRNWKIPTMKLEDGKTLVSLDHILSAMNVTMMVNPSSEIPLVLFRPYTVLDAYRMIIRNSNALFSWSEVDSGITTEDLKKMNQLSVLNSLFFDYSSHIATDAIFATWSDEILTVSEEQYQDAMIEVLSSFSTVDPSVTDSIDYETFTLQGDVSGITSNLAELIGIKDLAKVSEIASTGIEHASILVEAFSNALLYEQIADSEVNLLRNAFLQNRSQSIFDEPDLETVRNAASHLQTILDGGAESFWTQVADTLVEICAAVVSQLPSLTVINVATTITSLLPGMSEIIDQNNAFLIALNCTNLDAFCRYDYTVLANQLRTEGPSSQVLSGMKDTMMFSLQSTYCARELMMEYNVCTSDVSSRLKKSNAKTLEMIFFLQKCSTNMAGEEIDYQYKQWDTYLENVETNTEKTESKASKYFGTWEADANVTMELTGNSLMSIYGSGIKYGSEIIIREDGFFSFYIGITGDNQGEGTWTWNGNGFDYTLASFLNQTEVQGCLTVLSYNGVDYLVMNDQGADIYWKRNSPSTDETTNSSALLEKIDTDLVLKGLANIGTGDSQVVYTDQLTKEGWQSIASMWLGNAYWAYQDESDEDPTPIREEDFISTDESRAYFAQDALNTPIQLFGGDPEEVLDALCSYSPYDDYEGDQIRIEGDQLVWTLPGRGYAVIRNLELKDITENSDNVQITFGYELEDVGGWISNCEGSATLVESNNSLGYEIESFGKNPTDTANSSPQNGIIAQGKCGDEMYWTLYQTGMLSLTGTGRMDNFTDSYSSWKGYSDLITSIDIEHGINVIDSYAFDGCSNLVSVNFPPSIRSIGDGAFRGCVKLAEVSLPNQLYSLGTSAFAECKCLTSIVIPGSLKRWDSYSFESCYNLESVIIEDGVTEIPFGTFYTCIALNNVEIRSNVLEISCGAFLNCFSLVEISFNGTTDQWKSVSILSDGTFTPDQLRIEQLSLYQEEKPVMTNYSIWLNKPVNHGNGSSGLITYVFKDGDKWKYVGPTIHFES